MCSPCLYEEISRIINQSTYKCVLLRAERAPIPREMFAVKCTYREEFIIIYVSTSELQLQEPPIKVRDLITSRRFNIMLRKDIQQQKT